MSAPSATLRERSSRERLSTGAPLNRPPTRWSIRSSSNYDCSRLFYYNAVLDYADRKGMSWIAWAWWTPPAVSSTYTAEQRQFDICKFPALISDWSGTPSPSGQIIKARLATYR